MARPSRTEEEQPDTKGEVGGRGTPRRPPRGQGRGAGTAAARRWGGSWRGRGVAPGAVRYRCPPALRARGRGSTAGPPPALGRRGQGSSLGARGPGREAAVCRSPPHPSGPRLPPEPFPRTLPGCSASPPPSLPTASPLSRCGPALGSPPCSPSSPVPPGCPHGPGLPPPGPRCPPPWHRPPLSPLLGPGPPSPRVPPGTDPLLPSPSSGTCPSVQWALVGATSAPRSLLSPSPWFAPFLPASPHGFQRPIPQTGVILQAGVSPPQVTHLPGSSLCCQ